MSDIPDSVHTLATSSGGTTNQSDQSQSAPLSRSLLILYTCATVGSWIFMLVYLIEGATRPDYDAWQQAISALSLGPGGWLQQVNFVYFGLITLFSAFVWHLMLKGGRAAIWYPIMRCLEGLGLIADGFFSQDPAPGYPKGSLLIPPTLHGTLHVIFAFLAITSIAVGYFILATRFAQEPRWRGWATYCVINGLLTILFITLFGILNGHQSPIAGLFERLASNGVSTPFGLLVLIRVWQGVGFSTRPQASQIVPALTQV